MQRAMRQAFTLLELVLVMVILGIVVSVGSGIVAQSYEHYLVQRAVERATLKSEIATQQIANLLSYRISSTAIARNGSDLNDWVKVSNEGALNDTTHTVLEWIGMEYDSFSSGATPGWSGFCDLAASDGANFIITPGSDLDFASTVLSNIYPDNNGSLALFFRHTLARYGVNSKEYDPSCMGMIDADVSCINRAAIAQTSRFNFSDSVANRVVAEHYKLAASAFALWPQVNDLGNFDLYLYYGYRPWNGEVLQKDMQNKRILVRNVTVFKFAQRGFTFRFKLCVQEPIGNSDANITICKEKAVIL